MYTPRNAWGEMIFKMRVRIDRITLIPTRNTAACLCCKVLEGLMITAVTVMRVVRRRD